MHEFDELFLTKYNDTNIIYNILIMKCIIKTHSNNRFKTFETGYK